MAGLGYGIEAPKAHDDGLPAQAPVRFVVLIDSASSGTRQARLFLATRQPVAEFDASSSEALMMTSELQGRRGALGSEWDLALAGHSRQERAAAEVYTLEV